MAQADFSRSDLTAADQLWSGQISGDESGEGVLGERSANGREPHIGVESGVAHPAHLGAEGQLRARVVVAGFEDDGVVLLDIQAALTQEAGPVFADVAEIEEHRLLRGQGEADRDAHRDMVAGRGTLPFGMLILGHGEARHTPGRSAVRG